MPPQSRGNGQPPPPKPLPVPVGVQSKSTPNLPTLRSFVISSSIDSGTSDATSVTVQAEQQSPEVITSPSEPASIDDFSLDSANEPPSLSPTSSDEEDISAEEQEKAVTKAPPRPLYQYQHSRSHGHLAPQAFAPPFYGRPPIPLPPSPSLTSLLRPNFSSQFNSRPTTPDPSGDEGTTNTRGDATGSQTPNSAAASTLPSTFRTVPRASPKVPTYEYYGFTLYLTSSLVFGVYLLWSFLPSPFLHQLGIWYFPDRWWALAIPAWTVMLILYIYVALSSYNTGYLTLPMNSIECLVDEAANVAVVDAMGNLIDEDKPSWQVRTVETDKRAGRSRKSPGKRKSNGRSRQNSLTLPAYHGLSEEVDWRSLWNEGTDAVMDIPIGGVCEILYGLDDKSAEDISGNAHDR